MNMGKNRSFWCVTCLSVFLSVSCGQRNTQKSDTEKFSPNAVSVDLDNVQTLSVFDVFSDIEIIPLETTAESGMNYPITKFVNHDGCYYVLDVRQKVILIFDHEGRFIRKIDKKGRGPGEYVELYDFNINPFTGNLEMMTSLGTVNIYDITNEKFIKSFRIPMGELAVQYFASVTPDMYVFFNRYRDRECKVFFCSPDSATVLGEAFPFPEYIYRETFLNPYMSTFYTYQDTVRFVRLDNGVISNVNSDMTLTPRYEWDMGEYTFEISDLPEGKSRDEYNQLFRYMSNKYAYNFQCNAENSKYLFTRFMFKNRFYNLMYDKESGKQSVYVNFNEGIAPVPMVMDEKSMYMLVAVDELPFIVKPDILDARNRQILERLTEDDNPVIVKYNFKTEAQ